MLDVCCTTKGLVDMLTATKDLLLPTTVVGSWPRPTWFTENLNRRPFSMGMNDLAYREQFVDAVSTVAADQEYAGLDILTNGDYHLDNDWSGRSWWTYPLQRMAGMSELDLGATAPHWAAPNGTYMNEIQSGWRFPDVIGEIGRGIPLEFGKIWRVSQSRAQKPVKFGTSTADGFAKVLPNVRTDFYSDDRRQLTWDMATVLNSELRELVAAGCRVVQIEDPTVYVAAALGMSQDEIDFAVDVFNHEVEGLEDAEIWIHTCWGNPGAQGVEREQRVYTDEAIEACFRLNADVLNVESKSTNHVSLPLFQRFKGKLPMKVAVGFISHRTLQVESPGEVAADIRRALEFIDAEDLVLTSDCGFGRQGASRPIALYKAAALAQGANIVRRELGGEEREVPAAEASRQIDPSPLPAFR